MIAVQLNYDHLTIRHVVNCNIPLNIRFNNETKTIHTTHPTILTC